LELAGRHLAGGRAFLKAAETASPEARLHYLRTAAGLFLSAGHVDEGRQILHSVLTTVGIRAPRSPWAALVGLVVCRVWLRAVGLRVRERAPRTVAAGDRLRVDALFTAAVSFSMVQVIVGAYLQARHLIEALRVGDEFQVLRAVCLQVTLLAAAGGVESEQEKRLLALAPAMAERLGHQGGLEFCRGALGMAHFQRGRWRQAQALLDLRDSDRSFALDGLQSMRLFSIYTYFMLGNLGENARRILRLRRIAEERGDLYTQVNLAVPSQMRTRLAHDDPEGARQIVEEAQMRWTWNGFHVQHWQIMINAPDVDLYLGQGSHAYGLFMASMPKLRRSFLLHAAYIRIMTWFTVVRVTIASLDADPKRRRARLAQARRHVRRLGREADAWARVLEAMAEAIVENAQGHRAAAIRALRAAVEHANRTETVTYGVVATFRLGQALGDEEGTALVERAQSAMALQGIRDPSRWAAMYMPGTWAPGP
jgi:hypothetical protein